MGSGMINFLSIPKRLIRLLFHPGDFYTHRIEPIFRHYKYPDCHPSAIVNSPIKFNPTGVVLGQGVYIFKNARIGCVFEYAGEKFKPLLEIGEGTTIQQNVHITCAGNVRIGKFCALTHNITITDIDHSYEYPIPRSIPPILNKIIVNNLTIGDYCMIFPNAVILGGSVIGNNCIIAANAVVRGKFPDGCLIGGIPARIIKRYNPQSNKWERTHPDGSFIE